MERRRLLPALLAALLLMMAAPSGADFTASCPAECRCTWVSGKKQADCSGRQEVGLPLELSPEVQVLDLSGAEVPRLERDALLSAGLEHLQTLLLRGVRLQHLDKHALRGLHLLTRLDLSENQLTADQLDAETFADNPKLLQLSLAGNPLQRLDELQLPDLPQLQRLNLSHCQLASVSARAFRRLPALKYLHLDGNKLAVLDPVLFQSLGQLRSLTLHGNPWRCDCHLRLFRDWLVQHGLYQEGTWCVEPERLVGRRWTDARSEEFACRPQITIPEPTVVADVGENVTLSCQVSGNPAADTKWVLSGGRILRNNTPIPVTRQVYIIHEEGNVNRWTNLTITHVTEQDAGQYLCVGSNPGGVVERNVTLAVAAMLGRSSAEDASPLPPHLLAASIASVVLFLALFVVLAACWYHRRRESAARAKNAGRSEIEIVDPPTGCHEPPAAAASCEDRPPVPLPRTVPPAAGRTRPRMGVYSRVSQTDRPPLPPRGPPGSTAEWASAEETERAATPPPARRENLEKDQSRSDWSLESRTPLGEQVYRDLSGKAKVWLSKPEPLRNRPESVQGEYYQYDTPTSPLYDKPRPNPPKVANPWGSRGSS